MAQRSISFRSKRERDKAVYTEWKSQRYMPAWKSAAGSVFGIAGAVRSRWMSSRNQIKMEDNGYARKQAYSKNI